MKRFQIVIFAMVALVVALISERAVAQDKCEGPSELCAQMLQLKSELDASKKAAIEAKAAKAVDEKQVAALREQQKDQESKAVKFVGAMGSLAIVLKILLSLLTAWKDSLFSSDRGKAAIRIAILGVTLGIFLTTNMGFGIPWWQSLILAAGGPLSMVLHEMMKLIPVLRGKKKLPEDQTEKPPADDEPSVEPPADGEPPAK